MSRCVSLYQTTDPGLLLRCTRPTDHKDNQRVAIGRHTCGLRTWRTEDEAGVFTEPHELAHLHREIQVLTDERDYFIGLVDQLRVPAVV